MKTDHVDSLARGLVVRASSSVEDRQLVAGWLEAEHFLGALRVVGHTLMQFVQQENQVVAVLVWAASAYHLKDRDQWIGWDAITCAKRRNLITNNVRFLVRQEHRRPNLASQSLATALKVLPQQWQEHFGYRPLLAETFTDPELHAGTCYKASGWEALGHTKGYSRHRCDFYIPNDRPKRLWIKALHPRAREWLCAPQLPLECQAGQRPEGAGARCALKMKELQSLREALHSIPDPRTAKGRQYPLWTVLCVVALGLLSGCVHLSEIVRLGQRLSQAQRRGLGFRMRKNSRFYPAPGYTLYRELLPRLDLDAFAKALNGWLGQHRGQLPSTLAFDGKCIRENLGAIVTLLDVEEGVPLAVAATTVGKGGEVACARKLLQSDQVALENTTLVADSLHTNATNAHLIVSVRGANYIAAIKDNQPTLHQLAQKQLADTSPLFPVSSLPMAS
jgi:Druantia protein DruA/DDE_Tnp_1-associated